jgi:CxxC motif-containing protein (DUF1111 family)
LGPFFVTNSCQACHVKDGRSSRADMLENNVSTMVVKLGKKETNRDVKNGHVHVNAGQFDSVYGSQIQTRAVIGVKPEANIHVQWQTVKSDDYVEAQQRLEYPVVSLQDLNYGPLDHDTLYSMRAAPTLIGLGLIELVPEQHILQRADPSDLDGDGISGRPNWVHDAESGERRIGRFGWKASQSSLRGQNALAFRNDLGLTSRLVSAPNCTESQLECLSRHKSKEPEVSDKVLGFVTFYTQSLAVPSRRIIDKRRVTRGQKLFKRIGCEQCHVASFTTLPSTNHPERSKQIIYPYTDLLLHDMGDGLADGTTEALAQSTEWRTAPLWGLGYTLEVNPRAGFLHDGRAKSITEAILWHGGEAQAARDAFINLADPKKNNVVQFLNSL